MKQIVLLTACLLAMALNGQKLVKELHTEINEQVWRPFQKAFENLDGEGLNAIYADDVLRVTPDGIDTQNAFKHKNLERFKQYRLDGVSIALDFWFDSRNTNKNTSYEVGFYRITATSKDGETTNSYGQFHIVLKKINGRWKITQDWDTTTINGEIITKKAFEKQTPLQFQWSKITVLI